MSSNSNAGATSLGSGQSNLDDLKDMPTFETVARRHLLNSTAVSRDEYKWNGDPSEWESWPVGRPGPFVSEPVELNLLRYFKIGEQNHFLGPPDEPAFHIAKFSDNGQG